MWQTKFLKVKQNMTSYGPTFIMYLVGNMFMIHTLTSGSVYSPTEEAKKSSAPQNEPKSVDRTNSLPPWVYYVRVGAAQVAGGWSVSHTSDPTVNMQTF
jgi:hypothetical protein